MPHLRDPTHPGIVQLLENAMGVLVPERRVPGSHVTCEGAGMNCIGCGRLVCPLRNSPHVIFCRDFVSPEIMARALRDTPPNEALIRGMRI